MTNLVVGCSLGVAFLVFSVACVLVLFLVFWSRQGTSFSFILLIVQPLSAATKAV